ncbi:hypothetical protein ACSSS7_002616 [Eimeria intestinalis]
MMTSATHPRRPASSNSCRGSTRTFFLARAVRPFAKSVSSTSKSSSKSSSSTTSSISSTSKSNREAIAAAAKASAPAPKTAAAKAAAAAAAAAKTVATAIAASAAAPAAAAAAEAKAAAAPAAAAKAPAAEAKSAAADEVVRSVKADNSPSNDEHRSCRPPASTQALMRPPAFHGQRPQERLAKLRRDPWLAGLPKRLRVEDAFKYLEGSAFTHLSSAQKAGKAPTTWEDFERFILSRFSHQSVGESIKRLRALRWKGSLERLVARFDNVVAESGPPPEANSVRIFVSRIPFRFVGLLCHQHFDTWSEAKEALSKALAPEECANSCGYWMQRLSWYVNKGLHDAPCSSSNRRNTPIKLTRGTQQGCSAEVAEPDKAHSKGAKPDLAVS